MRLPRKSRLPNLSRRPCPNRWLKNRRLWWLTSRSHSSSHPPPLLSLPRRFLSPSLRLLLRPIRLPFRAPHPSPSRNRKRLRRLLQPLRLRASAGVAFNLNTCTAEELVQNIEGCSSDLAHSIIEYRNKIGSFKRIEDLLDVPGITKAAYTNPYRRASSR